MKNFFFTVDDNIKFLKQITLRTILDLLLITGVLTCSYAICQNLGYDFLWPFDIGVEFGSSSYSTFGNPNFLSSFIFSITFLYGAIIPSLNLFPILALIFLFLTNEPSKHINIICPRFF